MAWGIVGHERPVALLERALDNAQQSHAYLISGPRDVGKRTLALELGRATLCLDRQSGTAACRACVSCARFESANHPDLRIVELDAEHVQISRQEIGRIQADAALKPLMGVRKVYVLVEVERLSPIAGNQLLKLIEEPPAGLMFVLTTADVDAVLPTIVSRCQLVRTQPVPRETIESHLSEALGVDPATSHSIAEAADGRVGWAIRAGADPTLLEARSAAIEDLVALIESGRLKRLLKSQELAARWTGDRAGVIDELDWWARSLRDLAVSAVVPKGSSSGSPREPRLSSIAGRLGSRDSIDGARAAQRTVELLVQNVNPRIALDTLVIDLPALT